MEPLEPDDEIDELQGQLSADVQAVETKEDFEQVLAIWSPRIRPPLSLESLFHLAHSRGWI